MLLISNRMSKENSMGKEEKSKGPPESPGNGNGQGPKPKDVTIEVNGREVVVSDREVTGVEIKQAAISGGVAIQLNFVLQLELANGTSKVIGDNVTIRVHPHMSFTAIAPDDNS
jgi:hypothetical protein